MPETATDNLLRASTYGWVYNEGSVATDYRGQYNRPKLGALVHITSGEKNSRTGTNERALCGTSVWPTEFPLNVQHRLCKTCASKTAWRR